MYENKIALEIGKILAKENIIPIAIFLLLEISLIVLSFTIPRINLLIVGGVIAFLTLLFIFSGTDHILKSIIILILIATIPFTEFVLEFFQLKIHDFAILIVLTVILLKLLVGKQRYFVFPTKIGKPLLFFIAMVIFTSLLGFLNDHSLSHNLHQVRYLIYYSLFFIIVYFIRDGKQVKWLGFIIIFSSFVVAIEYITVVLATGSFSRISQHNVYLLYVAFPLLFSLLLYSNSKNYKVVSMVVLIPIIIAIIFSRSRTGWVCFIIELFVLLLLFLLDKGLKPKYILTSTMVLMSTIFVITVLWGRLYQLKGLKTQLSSRIESYEDITGDYAFLMRIELNSYAIQKYLKHPVIGSGLGDIVKYRIFSNFFERDQSPEVIWIDNTYLNFLWKTGTIGFVIFLWLYYTFLGRSYYVFKNTKDQFAKWFSLGIFATFLAFQFYALMAPVLDKYRLNIIWAIIMGIIELQAQTIESSRLNKYKLK